MKRVLFLTAYPPNDRTAGQHYTYQLLTELCQYYIVDLYYWTSTTHDILAIPNINIVRKCSVSKFTKWFNLILIPLFPLFTKRFTYGYLRELKSIIGNYDYLYFDFSQTFIYSLFLKHPVKILMSHDVILQKYSRKKFSFFYSWWIKFSEGLLLKSGSYIYTFSDKDCFFIKDNYHMKSNPVAFYICNNIKNIDLKEVNIDDFFVMYGAWNRWENAEGLQWLLENIDCFPSKVQVIGGGLSKKLQDKILKRDDIEYLGFVVNPYEIIVRSKGLLAPLFQGAGVKVKVIETLALGTPVIGTEIAFEGIPNILYRKGNVLLSAHDIKSVQERMRELDDIKIEDKITIKQNFFSSYGNKKFVNYIKKF